MGNPYRSIRRKKHPNIKAIFALVMEAVNHTHQIQEATDKVRGVMSPYCVVLVRFSFFVLCSVVSDSFSVVRYPFFVPWSLVRCP